MKLKSVITELCRYSFEHMRTYASGSTTTNTMRWFAMDLLAYQIACFISNNTVEGDNGVESQSLLQELEDAYNNLIDLEKDFVEPLIKLYGGELTNDKSCV